MDSATCYTSFGGSCPSGGDNSWGTHTSRIVRDSAGYIFQADMLQNGTWAVRRRDTSGVWSTVLSAALNSSNSRPNNLLLDPSDHLHVYNWNGTAMTEYVSSNHGGSFTSSSCLLYTSDAADERSSVDLGGRRIIKKKKKKKEINE